MCGIAGVYDLSSNRIESLDHHLKVLGDLISHRGPDGSGEWADKQGTVGFVHKRLSIIDLSASASQPMTSEHLALCFNGEIYNYKELFAQFKTTWAFKSTSDTETILAAYQSHGVDCLAHLRGMFAFALYDQKQQQLFCARDRFGIKPFYYVQVQDRVYFASEAKALLPFLPSIETDEEALTEYLTFQYSMGEKTLFKGIKQLLPGHALAIKDGKLSTWQYWDVKFEIDHDHSAQYFDRHLKELMEESIALHCRSDVEIGSYLSGGIDSSLIHLLANQQTEAPKAFNGKFTQFDGYDESQYAEEVVQRSGGELFSAELTAADFSNNIRNVIYHLDFPTAGPGSFAQYMISQVASNEVKVVLGGQGGDEIFGGYARYTVAYLEQCLKAAIDGTYKEGNFVVTIESIIPNLGILKEYKPMIKQFWKSGLFESMDKRYFQLIDRSADVQNEISHEYLQKDKVFERFEQIFNNPNNVAKHAYFDKMTHFDFKCFLPALLQVEDRMSMAHGIESRVPFLDHPLIEFSATIPADVKFKDGNMKHMLKHAYRSLIPQKIVKRRDKMGFPVPLKEWYESELQDEIRAILSSLFEKNRPFMNDSISKDDLLRQPFSRKTWGLLSLELWYQTFHDRAGHYRNMLKH